MDKNANNRIGRRALLRIVASVGVGAAATALSAPAASTDPATKVPSDRGKRKAQYQGNSQEIQTFYRVNRYPKK